MTEPPKMLDVQAHDRSLGWMIREAATVELYLETIVKILCGSQYGALLISGAPTTRLIDACRALVDARPEVPEEDRKALKQVLVEAKAAFELRNNYVHGPIAWEANGIPGNTRSRHLKASRDFHPFDVNDLQELAAQFNRLTFRCTDFLMRAQTGFPGVQPDADGGT
ncbi:hypothetical protein [Streptomyces drozdowiczii]|uniref:hypothetical protein n=1 Tax=Streptomyces drozdowiczii TaxID=202862 RepID=UPI00403C2363